MGGTAVVSSLDVVLFNEVFAEAFNALGGIQLFDRNAAIEGVVVKAVSAGSSNGARFFDNPTGVDRLDACCAHIVDVRLQRASKAISTIIYLMKVRLSLRCL